jgi:hypothetical protein
MTQLSRDVSRIIACLTAVLAMVLLSACDDAGSAPTPPTPSSSVTTDTTPSDEPSSAATAKSPIDVRQDDSAVGAAFVSPSGNLWCWINAPSTQDDRGDAGCVAREHTWTAPEPEETCYASYGDMVAVSTDGAQFVCRGDIPTCFVPSADNRDACGPGATGNAKPAHWWHRASDGLTPGREVILPYDTAIRIAGYQCTSLEAGMKCEHLPSRHWFSMSRSAVTPIGGATEAQAGPAPAGPTCGTLLADGDTDGAARLAMASLNARNGSKMADCLETPSLMARFVGGGAPRPLTTIGKCALTEDLGYAAITCRATGAHDRDVVFAFNSGSAGEMLSEIAY